MKIFKILEDEKIRYLLAGTSNTVCGYFLVVGAYIWLEKWMNIIYISILANILGITISFLTYKIFVFRTPGNWLKEYLKIYLVYGLTAIIGTLLLWLFVASFGINIWLGQGMVLICAFSFSFFLNRYFTFKRG
jgi:putative flippase GtrA